MATYEPISRNHPWASLGGVSGTVAPSGQPSTLAPTALKVNVSGVDAAVVGCRLYEDPDRFFGFRDMAVDGDHLLPPSPEDTVLSTVSLLGLGDTSAVYGYARLVDPGHTVLVREEFDTCGGGRIVLNTWTWTKFWIQVDIMAEERAAGMGSTTPGYIGLVRIHFREPNENYYGNAIPGSPIPREPRAFSVIRGSPDDWFHDTFSNEITATANNDADIEASNGGTMTIRPATVE